MKTRTTARWLMLLLLLIPLTLPLTAGAQPQGWDWNYIYNVDDPPPSVYLWAPQDAWIRVLGEAACARLYVGPVYDMEDGEYTILSTGLYAAGGVANCRVGIRTLSPQAALDVRGDERVSDNILVGSGQLSVLPRTGAGTPSASAALGQIYIDTAANDAWIFVGDGIWKKITCCETASRVEPPDAPSLLGGVCAAPNPMRAATTIRFTVAGPEPVRVEIYDAAGRRVREIARGTLPEGTQALNWDGRGEGSQSAPPGVYFIRITQGDRREDGKIVLTD